MNWAGFLSSISGESRTGGVQREFGTSNRDLAQNKERMPKHAACVREGWQKAGLRGQDRAYIADRLWGAGVDLRAAGQVNLETG